MAEEEYAVMMEMCKLGETAKVLVSCGVENIVKHASRVGASVPAIFATRRATLAKRGAAT